MEQIGRMCGVTCRRRGSLTPILNAAENAVFRKFRLDFGHSIGSRWDIAQEIGDKRERICGTGAGVVQRSS